MSNNENKDDIKATNGEISKINTSDVTDDNSSNENGPQQNVTEEERCGPSNSNEAVAEDVAGDGSNGTHNANGNVVNPEGDGMTVPNGGDDNNNDHGKDKQSVHDYNKVSTEEETTSTFLTDPFN